MAAGKCYAITLLLTLCVSWLITTTESRPWGQPSICLQPPPRSEGLCTLEIEGYYYEPRSDRCEMYVVGGCRASRGQSFGTRQDCEDTCIHMTRFIEHLRINE